jgi:LPXTG-motif cell wall-anchored protein
MRRIFATLAVAGVVGATALGALALPAGAGVSDSLSCSFTASSTDLTGPGPVQVSGTAPASTEVHIFLQVGATTTEVPGSPVLSDAVTGAWGPITVDITATSTIVVSVEPAYSNLPCTGVGLVSVSTVTAGLPRTGSNDTGQYVVAALVLIAVGSVLVVGAKRRRDAHSRV